MEDRCRYCMTPLDPTTDCGCGCDGERIAQLEARVEALQEGGNMLINALEDYGPGATWRAAVNNWDRLVPPEDESADT